MNCPDCNTPTKVVDSRTRKNVRTRRRECVVCKDRFTTKEYNIEVLRAFKKQYLLLQQEVQQLKVGGKYYDTFREI